MSNSPETVVSSRSFSSTGEGRAAALPKPSPAARALASARASHHRPKASVMSEAMMPMPGAAKVVVPK